MVARRKRKEDEPDWTPPEFDEVAFMRKEIENAKIAVVVVAWATVGAIVGILLYAYVHPAAGFLVGLATFGGLYFVLPLIGLPIQGYKRRDWINRFGTYFFCWLAFFILLLNPPFSDHTPPSIQFEAAASYTSVGLADPPAHFIYCVPASASAVVNVKVGSNNTLYVLFRATDNVGIQAISVRASSSSAPQNLTPTDVSNRLSACSNSPNGTVYGPGTYAVNMVAAGVPVTFTVLATDRVGLSASGSFVLNPTT